MSSTTAVSTPSLISTRELQKIISRKSQTVRFHGIESSSKDRSEIKAFENWYRSDREIEDVDARDSANIIPGKVLKDISSFVEIEPNLYEIRLPNHFGYSEVRIPSCDEAIWEICSNDVENESCAKKEEAQDAFFQYLLLNLRHQKICNLLFQFFPEHRKVLDFMIEREFNLEQLQEFENNPKLLVSELESNHFAIPDSLRELCE